MNSLIARSGERRDAKLLWRRSRALWFGTREAHPFWDTRKLLEMLRPMYTRLQDWPAPSTVADLLARRSLVPHRRKHPARTHHGMVAAAPGAPNDLWAADFKGQFRTCDYVTAIRERLRICPRAICSRVTACTPRHASWRSRSSSALFARAACPVPFAPTMASRLPPPPCTACRFSTSSECKSALSINASRQR